MTKSEQIAKFIQANQPIQRKEIVKFIVVELNKRCTADFFDKNYAKYRGNYSYGFGVWVALGNVTVKNGCYSLTKQCIDNGYKMYCEPLESKYKKLKARHEEYVRKSRETFYQNSMLKRRIYEFNQAIGKI